MADRPLTMDLRVGSVRLRNIRLPHLYDPDRDVVHLPGQEEGMSLADFQEIAQNLADLSQEDRMSLLDTGRSIFGDAEWSRIVEMGKSWAGRDA